MDIFFALNITKIPTVNSEDQIICFRQQRGEQDTGREGREKASLREEIGTTKRSGRVPRGPYQNKKERSISRVGSGESTVDQNIE